MLFIGLLLAACSSKSTTISAPNKEPKASANKTVQALVPLKEEDRVERETYTYEAKARDPFFSLVELAKEKPQRKKGTTPMENFDLSEIKLNAIVWDNTQFYALITLPDAKSYTVKKGMALGLNGGRVDEITKRSVLIHEQIKDFRGQSKSKETILKLRKEGE